MSAKKVLIAGATGLVGRACLRHFASQKGCEVVALSRRKPDETWGARWFPLDLSDGAACANLAPELAGVTHLVYAALYERPGLVAMGTDTEPVPLTGLAANFSPMPRMAPPPLGSSTRGDAIANERLPPSPCRTSLSQ